VPATTEMNKIINYLLLTRPYSWLNIALIAMVAGILGSGEASIDYSNFFDAVYGILTWIFVLVFSESIQKDVKERVIPPKVMTLLLFAVLSFISVLRNPISLIFCLTIIPVVYFYSKKTSSEVAGLFSFISRGGIELSIILGVYSMNTGTLEFDNIAVVFLISVYFITMARNLMGDLRDIKFDKNTLPKLIGEMPSRVLVVSLILFVVFINFSVVVGFPLLIMCIILIINSDAYINHKIFILCTTFFLLSYILSYRGIDEIMILFINLTYLSVFFIFTYDRVPRKK
jgi:4-hydroxybenzoate polyprenyltransferase